MPQMGLRSSLGMRPQQMGLSLLQTAPGLGLDYSTGCTWYDTSPLATPEAASSVIMDYVVNGLDIGYEIDTERL